MEQKIISTVEFEKKFDEKGYIFILVDGKWVREHIYVVEQQIGRHLEKNECVHHLDHNRMNNYIDNLMLFDNQEEHKRFENKVKQFGFTRPILRQIKHRWDKYGKN